MYENKIKQNVHEQNNQYLFVSIRKAFLIWLFINLTYCQHVRLECKSVQFKPISPTLIKTFVTGETMCGRIGNVILKSISEEGLPQRLYFGPLLFVLFLCD